MEKKYLIFIIGVVLISIFFLCLIKADEQTNIICGGDAETQIICSFGDQENNFVGVINGSPDTSAPVKKEKIKKTDRIVHEITGEKCSIENFNGLEECARKLWDKYWIFALIILTIIVIMLICLFLFILGRKRKKKRNS